MSVLTFPGGLIMPMIPDFNASAPTFVNSTLNDGVDRVAYVFRAPKTGTLDWFEFRQNANTTPPNPGLRFSFQDLDGSGDPDGTEDQFADVITGFGAGAWLVPPNVMTDTGLAGGTRRSVTIGDPLAAVISIPSFVAGNVQLSQLDLNNAVVAPTLVHFMDIKAAAWTKNFNTGCIALKYSTGYEIISPNTFPVKAVTTVSLNSGSSPNELGLRFLLSANAYISGFIIRIDLDGPVDISLYSGTTVIAPPASLLSANRSTANGGYAYVKFPQTLLAANTVYRIGVAPTSGTNVSLYHFDVDNAGVMAAAPPGAEFYYSTRAGGAWTDTTTRRLWCAVVIDGIDSTQTGAETSHMAIA